MAFVLSTLQTREATFEAAIGIDEAHYLLYQLDHPMLSGKSVYELLQNWSSSNEALQVLAREIRSNPAAFSKPKAVDAALATPIRFPNKLLAVGANYADHLEEMGLPVEKWVPMPFFACPPSTSIVGPGKTVRYPCDTKQFDWECELVIVLGANLRNASLEEASAAIAGYTIGLDLSCRDLMVPGKGGLVDLMRGKSQDTMKPCGPSFVPKSQISDPNNLSIKLSVNDELMIDGTTTDMIWKPEECLVEMSKTVTLEPGDMVLTGTPAGSAKSHGERWLKVGDRITAQIEGLGSLEVEVIE